MTRRQRMLRIIENMGERQCRFHIERLLVRRGLSILTDDAVDDLAGRIMSDHFLTQKRNRENRAIAAAQGAKS